MKCKYCPTEHDNKGTRLCNNCWELSRRGCECLASKSLGWSAATYVKDNFIIMKAQEKWTVYDLNGAMQFDGTIGAVEDAHEFNNPTRSDGAG